MVILFLILLQLSDIAEHMGAPSAMGVLGADNMAVLFVLIVLYDLVSLAKKFSKK